MSIPVNVTKFLLFHHSTTLNIVTEKQDSDLQYCSGLLAMTLFNTYHFILFM